MLKPLAVVLAAGVAVLVAWHGAGEEGVREVIRWTARASLLLLCAALATEGGKVRRPRWAERSELLRGLALSHTVHAVAVARLAMLLGGRNLIERSSPLAVFGGALAYAFIFWGAWKPRSRVTSVGLVWIWGVFVVSYGTRALRMPIPFGLAVGLLVVAMLVRLRELVPRPARVSTALLLTLGLAATGSPADKPKSLLAVFAHPDDETLVGPLLASYARRGVRVNLAIVTDGEKGVRPHAGIPEGPELAKARAEEARCSCRALGIEAPMLLGFKDGELGRMARPPWGPLAEVERALSKVFEQLQPDVVITFGPDGGYGHPDHRLVGTVVTQLVQAGAAGAPARLFYPGFPKDRLPPRTEADLPWSPTDGRFLTVRVPYEAGDLAASRAALACHKSQFRAEEIERLAPFMDRVLGGRVYLRPWFGAGKADDVFRVPVP